ncbi:lipopolysaccharide biosynthesis protein [Streptomyces sp. A3M-1-3]|uniref:lipopolysaccharide biosynthesis protein n=1 Tax=Streptomyces sp. A3M-1-3 TaxID=2962044 RepID=UPI0020B64A6E|nr:lipopolysaccharide biosynthesis protein [Streptomyces sp. A3M-1-3]MCP3820518.1 lipopolysaccharide biosynthesis protein [Streptomyces sp. A3M-1-3]
MGDTRTREPSGSGSGSGSGSAPPDDVPVDPDGTENTARPGSGGEGGDGDGGDSMFRNAYALMLSTGVSAALGLGFWLVAARYYSKEAVGVGSAAIAAQRLLASLTATTMIGAVVRYVPRAGRATGALVLRTYLVSSVVVALACGVFLLTLDLWGPTYAPLGGLGAGLFFTASCVAWAVLTLQDGVLTGLRRAIWVPVGNAGFSLGKLVLLAVFATAMPVLGVFVSWSVAIALSVLPLGWLVFRRLIPRQAAADRDREPPALREIGRFLAGDSVGALFSLAMINLLPVMVAVRFDAAHNGFFYIAYTVGGTMEFMAINMASSLTAHASHSPDRLADGVRGALRRMAVLLVPVVLVLIVFAPQILAPFGAAYAEHGTTVLRLLAAAALPRVVVELYIGVLRVQGRTGMLAALQGAMCVLVLGSAALLLGPVGISGAGLAMLLSMTLMALVAAPGLRAALSGRPPRRIPFGGRFRRKGDKAEEYGTSWARRAAELRAEAAESYGGRWAEDTAYLRGAHDGVTPAFGIPVLPDPDGPRRSADRTDEAADGGENRLTEALWLLLGLAAGLFWVPLARAAQDRPSPAGRLSGTGLTDALPPVTLTAGVLLVVIYSAAVSLYRARPALLVSALVVTAAALHTAPLFLGVLPDRVAGPGQEALTAFLAGVAGLDGTDGVARVLPVFLQLLCLGLAAETLRALGTHWRITAGLVWVQAVAGWAAQQAFAAAALPVFLGFLGLYAATAVGRAAPRSRPQSRRQSR